MEEGVEGVVVVEEEEEEEEGEGEVSWVAGAAEDEASLLSKSFKEFVKARTALR